jgi:hypothetical protein
MGMVIAVVAAAGFLVGAIITAALGCLSAVLIVRDSKRRRHGWLVFGLTTALLLPCALLLIHSRPPTLNLPDSLDLKNFFLNCIGFGSSLGASAAVACAVTLIIPRPKKSNLPPPLPKQPVPSAVDSS